MIADYKPSEWQESVSHSLVFDDGHGNGFWFPCSPKGEPILTDSNRPNYEYAVANPVLPEPADVAKQ